MHHRSKQSCCRAFCCTYFAAAARQHGRRVTLVEAQAVPLAHVLGEEVGGRLAEIHEAAGNVLVTGVGVARVEGYDRVSAVVLDDGRRLPADLVVVGIGARPGNDDSEGAPAVASLKPLHGRFRKALLRGTPELSCFRRRCRHGPNVILETLRATLPAIVRTAYHSAPSALVAPSRVGAVMARQA